MNDTVKDTLIHYARRAAGAGLFSGASGNVSARDGNIIWIKASGAELEVLSQEDLCGVDLRTGEQVTGDTAPSSDQHMHLEIYRARPDVAAVFHGHAPWTTGLISSGIRIRPLSVNFVSEAGRWTTLPYYPPSTRQRAEAIAVAIRDADMLFMTHHGIVATGAGIRQAYCRVRTAEEHSKSIVAAHAMGKPAYMNDEQIAEVHALRSIQDRQKTLARDPSTAPPAPTRAADDR